MWHQVFEHRAAPRQENRIAADDGHHPAQREPVFLRDLSHRDGDETGQACLGSEKIVITVIDLAVSDVVTDGQQVGGMVVQEGEIHLRKIVDLSDEISKRFKPFPRFFRGVPDTYFQFFKQFLIFLACFLFHLFKSRDKMFRQFGNLLQAHVPVQLGNEVRLVLPAGKENPGCQIGQFIQLLVALGEEGVAPEAGEGFFISCRNGNQCRQGVDETVQQVKSLLDCQFCLFFVFGEFPVDVDNLCTILVVAFIP